jgi:hypothetical protein
MISFTADQIVAHLVGDYVLQSDWMANKKTRYSIPAAVHALFYTLPFLFITLSWQALLIVAVSHFVIDRWRLARFVCWAKNFIGWPPTCYGFSCGTENHVTHFDWMYLAWRSCSATGYNKDKPPWMAVWLMIITDNVLHLICNAVALSIWSS